MMELLHEGEPHRFLFGFFGSLCQGRKSLLPSLFESVFETSRAWSPFQVSGAVVQVLVKRIRDRQENSLTLGLSLEYIYIYI